MRQCGPVCNASLPGCSSGGGPLGRSRARSGQVGATAAEVEPKVKVKVKAGIVNAPRIRNQCRRLISDALTTDNMTTRSTDAISTFADAKCVGIAVLYREFLA